ncbi:peptidoglycan DD-metalloendopeptidase family protein [Hymenobacter caeli]|uniref:Murein DD-endopeptidase MepM/ murein hydrolase activator NlpD n=1 Tax=Hymenobacter caeli TaxID=2735894 RepID=A0ABX2FQU1_9BACT|nr:M23 family metallopeptidase [Hymenobacter caeli]NRT19545.1 murein DD-endopeptidase MepM/ murein hydrolase activator NlpD [Hymenobacter caeli]
MNFLRPLGLLWLLAALGTAPALGQGKKPAHPKDEHTGRRSDFFRVKTPKMKYVRPDTTTVIETEEIHDDNSDAAKSLRFNPAKKLSIVSEDTTTLNEGGQEIVEMSEEVLIDSSWVKVAGYYSIWDVHNINPYHVDGRRFRDSVNLKLTDASRERFSRMPMKETPITSGFGFRGYRWHFGVDLDLETGDSVKAVFDGVVRISKWDGAGYGNYLLVRHYNGLETLYGHLSKALVPVGTFVKAGELIAYGGSTGHSSGSHLHFEVRYQGNPINPIQLYDFPDHKLLKDNFTITSELFNYYSQALRRGGGSLTGGGRSGGGEGRGSRTSRPRRGEPRAARVVVSHRVRPGDTLSEVAEKYGVGLSTLKRLNPGMKTLQPGKKLRIK